MTTVAIPDPWARWLHQRRHGGDTAQQQALLPTLHRIRDEVLDLAQVAAGDVLLDVGAGDGLIAFAALPRVGPHGHVIFSDISPTLLRHGRQRAAELGVLDRVTFLEAAADDLSALPAGAVDVVTTRSVLIYVARKNTALREFYRVLRPGGRLALWEPINRFARPEPADRFRGIDVTPIRELAGKVRAVYEQLQPPATDPMLNFDERDLLVLAEAAGFAAVRLELRLSVAPARPVRWEVEWQRAANPLVPTLAEAVARVLTAAEAERFIAYLRPRVEAGARVERQAVAQLWARKA